MLFVHPDRSSAWCCTVTWGTLALLDIGLGMSALTWSLAASSTLLHPPSMLTTLFQTHSVPAVLHFFCELYYAICISITLHYQEKTVLGYV